MNEMSNAALDGKAALVTGASQSIGYASACALAADGAHVTIMGRREDALQASRDKMLAQIPQARIEICVGDACEEEDLKKALSGACEATGQLDILVPTVGGAIMQPIMMRDAASIRRELEVNYVSAFLAIRYGAPLMPRGGSIVCISTTAVVQAFFGLGLYGASKAALERMVRAAALELGGAGIRVNAVRPGMTVPEEVADDPEQLAAYSAFIEETPLGRVGVPQDISSAVRFLCGPESGWVTGQTFSVDGGLDQSKGPDQMDAIYGKEAMDAIRAGRPIDLPDDAFVPASTSLNKP